MITMLRGATSPTIKITLPEIPAQSVVRVSFCGAEKTFVGTDSNELMLIFSADETARFPLGSFPFQIRIRSSGGSMLMPVGERLLVTDDPHLVQSGTINLAAVCALEGETTVGEDYSIADLRNKVNSIIKRLGGSAIAITVLAFAISSSADVQTARLDELRNSSAVVTNVTDLVTVSNVTAIATEAVYRTQNMIYDKSTGVTWVRTMNNGFVYYSAITNTDVTVRGQ